jgi:CHAT domain-containing protein/tetratricopeptide (TPR) repeat protein
MNAWRAVPAAMLVAAGLHVGPAVSQQQPSERAGCAAAPAVVPPGRSGTAALLNAGCRELARLHARRVVDEAAPADLASALNDAGVLSEQQGLLQQAMADYERLLALPAGDERLRVIVLVNRAALLHRMGRSEDAAQAYQQLLPALEAARDERVLSAAESGLGLVEQALGRHASARVHLERALAMDRARLGDNHPEVARGLSNLGDVWRSTGEYGQAMALYERSLAIRRSAPVPDEPAIGNSLNKLADVLERLGDHERALALAQEALQVRRRALPAGHASIGAAHASIGDILLQQDRVPEAKAAYEAALQVQRAGLPPGHADIGETLDGFARAVARVGDLPRAEALAREAFEIRTNALGPGHARTAETLARLGTMVGQQGRTGEAVALQQRALAAARLAGVPEAEFSSGAQLARQLAARGDLRAATVAGKLAVNAMQRLRAGSRSLDAGLQRSLVRENGAIYQELATWLVDQGRLAEAEEVLAMLKEDELGQVLSRSDVQRTRATLSPAEAAALATMQEGESARLAEAVELGRLLARQRAREQLDDAAVARLAQLKARPLQWGEDFERWVQALRASEASVDTNALLVRGLEMKTVVRPDPGAVGLAYIVGEQRLAIVVTTGNASFGREVPVGRLEINRAVGALRQAIASRADVKPAAQALYRLLIAPVAADLEKAGATTLVLSLSDVLRYVPFAALHDGKAYLVERYAIANWLQAATGRGESAPSWRVAALGASRGGGAFLPLPSVPAELGAIVRTTGGTGPLPGSIRLDADFNRGALEGALDGGFEVVHIASHFDFKPADPSGSVLLLGDGKTMNLRELAALDYLNVQLLTLSACNTASGGGVNENGAEVEGLAAAVRRQGARSVLASLWPVADASTADLMRAFYGTRTVGLARALQSAQLAMLRGDARPLSTVDRGVTLSDAAARPAQAASTSSTHPFFWAPFVLSGEWR